MFLSCGNSWRYSLCVSVVLRSEGDEGEWNVDWFIPACCAFGLICMPACLTCCTTTALCCRVNMVPVSFASDSPLSALFWKFKSLFLAVPAVNSSRRTHYHFPPCFPCSWLSFSTHPRFLFLIQCQKHDYSFKNKNFVLSDKKISVNL